MKIRRPRGITTTQLMIITAIGVASGAYIWQPLILRYKRDNPSEIVTSSVEVPSISAAPTANPK